MHCVGKIRWYPFLCGLARGCCTCLVAVRAVCRLRLNGRVLVMAACTLKTKIHAVPVMSPVLPARLVVVADCTAFPCKALLMIRHKGSVHHSNPVTVVAGHGLGCAVAHVVVTGHTGGDILDMLAVLDYYWASGVLHGNARGHSLAILGQEVASQRHHCQNGRQEHYGQKLFVEHSAIPPLEKKKTGCKSHNEATVICPNTGNKLMKGIKESFFLLLLKTSLYIVKKCTEYLKNTNTV